MSALIQKLGIRPGQRICLLDGPSETMQDLLELFAGGADVSVHLDQNLCYDQILFWPQALHGLVERFAELQVRIFPDGAIWAIIPKKKYATGRGIHFTWEEMQAAGLQTELVDNKIASINDQDYGTRFVIRKEYRKKERSC